MRSLWSLWVVCITAIVTVVLTGSDLPTTPFAHADSFYDRCLAVTGQFHLIHDLTGWDNRWNSIG